VGALHPEAPKTLEDEPQRAELRLLLAVGQVLGALEQTEQRELQLAVDRPATVAVQAFGDCVI